MPWNWNLATRIQAEWNGLKWPHKNAPDRSLKSERASLHAPEKCEESCLCTEQVPPLGFVRAQIHISHKRVHQTRHRGPAKTSGPLLGEYLNHVGLETLCEIADAT